jgi:hypothetical protein
MPATPVRVIAAEIIGWHLAKALGVPVPDAGIYHDPEEANSMSFLSKAIQGPTTGTVTTSISSPMSMNWGVCWR